MNSWIFKENNFDLIRLIAAAQVAVLHTNEFMFREKTGTVFFEVLRLFPGVPIFFFISGYLISKSFERSNNVLEYSRNRIFRIFPALIVCVFVNIVMVWSTGYFSKTNPSLLDVVTLFLAKISFLQFYNPDFMRQFGDGVLNGSLWTICVELQFYVLTPILYFVLFKQKKHINSILIGLIVVFALLNRLLIHLGPEYSHEIWWKLFRVSFIPWIYMFLAGVLCQKNFATLSNHLSKIPFWPILIVYTVAAYIASINGTGFGNGISPLVFFPLIVVIFKFAYFAPTLARRTLKGNDISYGIYIWHMPIVNQMLYFNWRTEEWQANLAIALSIVLAVLSWFIIEKPALRLKHYSVRR